MALDNLKSVFTYRFGYDDELDHPSTATQWACTLAAIAGAHLGAVVATQRYAVSNPLGARLAAGAVAQENRQLAAAADKTVDELRAAAQAANIQADVSTCSATYPDIRDMLATQARLYDVTVADAAPDQSSMQRELLTDVLFHAGRPLVVVPKGAPAPAFDKIVVAWDGTAPATRALNDAMPLLRAAKQVDIVNILGDKKLNLAGSAAAILPHLQRHGIAAQAAEIQANGAPAQALLHHGTSTNANLIVMGAYAHSRLRQLVFGGFTSALLKDCPIPLFISH